MLPISSIAQVDGSGTDGVTGSDIRTVLSIVPAPVKTPVAPTLSCAGTPLLFVSRMLTGCGSVHRLSSSAFANDRVSVTSPELAPAPWVVKIAWHDEAQLMVADPGVGE